MDETELAVVWTTRIGQVYRYKLGRKDPSMRVSIRASTYAVERYHNKWWVSWGYLGPKILLNEPCVRLSRRNTCTLGNPLRSCLESRMSTSRAEYEAATNNGTPKTRCSTIAKLRFNERTSPWRHMSVRQALVYMYILTLNYITLHV
jgi:hypothetical protein